MSGRRPGLVAELVETLCRALGMVPHLVPLAQAIGFCDLSPRSTELAAIAVARSCGSAAVLSLHRIIGAVAGLTEAERAGDVDGLTPAERSAVALALGTIGRAQPDVMKAEPCDQHYTPDQLRQLQAVALSVELSCLVGRGAKELIRALR